MNKFIWVAAPVIESGLCLHFSDFPWALVQNNHKGENATRKEKPEDELEILNWHYSLWVCM